jgi:hypothetical protein
MLGNVNGSTTGISGPRGAYQLFALGLTLTGQHRRHAEGKHIRRDHAWSIARRRLGRSPFARPGPRLQVRDFVVEIGMPTARDGECIIEAIDCHPLDCVGNLRSTFLQRLRSAQRLKV